ncbi:MAG: thiamine-phosphate kinase [Candidatus Bathyarchaeota archaeon]|nr:thiamine-phosphate kinase [Candidatus Bathyarchaeota archaeon]
MNKRQGGLHDVRFLGEHKVIEIMRRFFEPMPTWVVPFGDDVSALPITGDGEVAVLKTDMLVDKTDVPRGMSLWQAARKAVVMNVSDFAAKGVAPKAALVSLGLPKRLLQTDVEEIAKGLNSGARQYGAYIVGGDTGEASDLIISVHLFGTAKTNTLMLRSGAKVGDIVAVTGFFGKSAAGLQILLNGFAASEDLREVLVSSVFMPQARLSEGLALQASNAVTASIDSSDGLAWSLHELARLSKVGLVISALPIASEVKCFANFNGLDACELALYGGEEYELVVTVDPKKWTSAEESVEAVGGRLLPIGKVTRDPQILLDVDGEKRAIEPRGWEHFKSPHCALR